MLGRPGTVGHGGVGVTILDRPAPDLGAIEFEAMQAKGFGSDEAVGTRRGAAETLFQEVNDGLGPRRGVVTTGTAWPPDMSLFAGTGAEVIRAQRVDPTAADPELRRGLGGAQRAFPKALHDVTDERRGLAMEQLLVLFRKVDSDGPARLTIPFRRQPPGRGNPAPSPKWTTNGGAKPQEPLIPKPNRWFLEAPTCRRQTNRRRTPCPWPSCQDEGPTNL